MTTQRLRAVVTLGGAVDNSLGSMTREFEQNTRRMNREVGSLSRQQERLAARIKKAVLAGKDTSQLTRQYQNLSIRIRNAADEAKRFADLSERGARANQRLSDSFRQSAYMAGGFGVATAGFAAAMTMTNQRTSDMDGIAKGYDMTLEQYKIWDAIGKRMGDGFDGTTIADLIEELGNKTGELAVSGKMDKYTDALKALNLDPKKIDKMSAYDRFITILKQTQKSTNKDAVKFVGDEIFGGNANRVLTYLQNLGVDIDDLINKQKSLNLLTEKGAEGAKKYNSAWSAATSAFGSAWEEVAGIVGGEVAPMLEQVTADFVAWFSNDANKKDLVETLKEAGRQLRQVGGVIVDVALATNTVAQAFGGWGNVAVGIAAFMGGKLVYSIGAGAVALVKMTGGIGAITAAAKAGIVAMKGFRLATLATPLGIFVGLGTLAYTVWENWEWLSEKLGKLWGWISDQWRSITGDTKSTHSVVEEREMQIKQGRYNAVNQENSTSSYLSGHQNNNKMISQSIEHRINGVSMSGKSQVNNNIGEIHVHTKEGQSPKEFGQAVYEKFTAQKFHDFAEAY